MISKLPTIPGLIITLLAVLVGFAKAEEPVAREDTDGRVEAHIALATAWAEQYLIRHDIPGAAIAFVQDDKTYIKQGLGKKNERGEKVDENTLFRLCSLAKPFTAISLAAEEERGGLSFDDKITDYVGNFPTDAAEAPELRALLLHVGGAPAEAPFPYFVELKFPTRAEILSSLPTIEFKHAPYEHYEYSNVGFVLAAEAIQQVSGKSWGAYMNENVFTSIGMNDAIPDLNLPQTPSNYSDGFTIVLDEKRRTFSPYQTNGLSPAAGILASISDMDAFMRWHFRVLDGKDNDLITAAGLRKLLRVGWAQPDGRGARRGLGYGFYESDNTTFVGHGGYCSGYRSVMALNLASRAGVTALINVNDASPYDLAFGVLQIMSAALSERHSAAERESNSDLDQFAGVYDRWGMPERVKIVSDGSRLIVMNLFTDSPWRSLKSYIPIGGGRFQNESDPTEIVEFEAPSDGRAMRFWQYPRFHYLTRMD
ncbi:serine hydrolase domain-containing protein [Hyphococcus sp.]|uniref:serine hydrolase domain-containing protein n=1 Tax=Hyphococcus sp. TaxID=2038636 RepID=UPI003CCB8BE2